MPDTPVRIIPSRLIYDTPKSAIGGKIFIVEILGGSSKKGRTLGGAAVL
jgi:hypothetical protein